MKVLQLISSAGFYGAENVMVQLASDLLGEKSCFIVAGVFRNSHSPHMEIVDVCRSKGIQTMEIPCSGRLDLRSVLNLRHFILANRIDIIHCHGYKASAYSYLASLGLTVAAVATCHNWLGDSRRMQIYATLDRLVLRSFNRIFAVSEAVQQQLIQSGIPEHLTRVVPNGISFDSFAYRDPAAIRETRNQLGIPENVMVVGTVGRLSTEKGHRHLLNVAESIRKNHPDTVFLMVGDGELRRDLEAQFRHPFIIFAGFRSDVRELYRCMDIFTLPSLTEGLPMVLLEAMASGLPVVATRVGAVPTVVADGETGFLVEPGNEPYLKEAITQLLKNTKMAREMGKSGHKVVRERFSSSQMSAKYLNAYRELMRERTQNMTVET